MALKFRRRIKIAPGVYINIGKSGITSATIGKNGSSINVGGKGVKATAGIPGTGLSYTSDNLTSGKKKSTKQGEKNQPERLGFFDDSALFDDEPDEVLPIIPSVLTSKEYKNLSQQEKDRFKFAGGKVKISTWKKILIAFLVMVFIGWLSDDRKQTEAVTPTAVEQSK
ncbi:TPA: DUF4236 domain-containing protein [Yersinia enterocolitica]|nr:DUF4236 domain-containing protein [Yersinia enterocolitica]HDQ4038846.1 DUF4236 domain-containing protein [Yersinia enterocolitica]